MSSRRGIGAVGAQLPAARAALAFAEPHHARQRRTADGALFIRHPIEIATLLYYAGAPGHAIAAGLLHDVIEKSSIDRAQLREQFGARVTAIVQAVSEDEAVFGYQGRKAALRRQVACAGKEALMVFTADRSPRPASYE